MSLKYVDVPGVTKSKIKRTRLTYADKLAIIRRINEGVDKRIVAEQFRICESTVRKTLLKKKEVEEINKYELPTKKSAKSPDFPLIDSAVSTWFYQAREIGEEITGPLLSEKALEFWNIFISIGAIPESMQKKFIVSSAL